MEMEGDIVLGTLEHDIHHLGVVAKAGSRTRFSSGCDHLELIPILVQDISKIDWPKQRLVDDRLVGEREFQEERKTMINLHLILRCTADMDVVISTIPVARNIIRRTGSGLKVSIIINSYI
jgi:hypothetical protein